MKTNFAFLEKDLDINMYYDSAKKVEKLYSMGEYTSESLEIRKILENVAKMILDYNFIEIPTYLSFNDSLRLIKRHNLVPNEILDAFYELKSSGNDAAHNMVEFSRERGLSHIKLFYNVMVWVAREYTDERPKTENFEEPQVQANYLSFEKKLIYVQTVDGNPEDWPKYAGSKKIGDASINEPESDYTPNSKDMRAAAEKRVRSYMRTAGVPYKIQWAELAYRKTDRTFFRDYDVHEVLERSNVKRNTSLEGREWFLTDLDTAKAAIRAVKEGRHSLDTTIQPINESKIVLRPEQAEAIKVTKKAFKKYDTMLWNAKMRFGKTLTALQLIKNEKYKKVLIMTHRPVVSDSWFDDFHKMEMKDKGYVYGSRDKGKLISELKNSDKPFVYFASIQDLRGSKIFGGKAGDKNREFTQIQWDLVIIDEAHEGTQTELAQKVINGVKKENTKLLELSGTPFNLLDQYEDDQVYTWDYVMEQEAKYKWNKEKINEANPYESLPKVSMFTFEISDQFANNNYQDLVDKSFNFKEFFRTNEQGDFVHEVDVKHFLDNITTPDDKNNYPFSTKEFRNNLRHTLWILPGVKEANALEKLLKNHPVFGMDYNIVNVVRNDKTDNVEETKENDLQAVRQAIGEDPSISRTITLTVRKLTTGVNVPEWSGVVFLSNTNSAMQYLQAAFRAQTPFSHEKLGRKEECFIFDFAPDRALTVMAESSRLSTGVGKRTTSVQKDKMRKLLNFMPIIGKTGNKMKRFEVDTLLSKIKRVYAEKAVRTGFDDDSLYSDELLMLDQVDLKDFNDLKAIVGTTKKEKSPMKVDINNQGMSEEEYEKAEKAKKKKRRERTEEEKAVLEKEKQLKKQRKAMISILRSISIRIPMMIYGMDINIKDDVNMRKFVKLVDDVSWQEFMPEKVSKELFLKFSKYYDQDVFIEAGRIIRRRVKKLDSLDPLERANELALIFNTFRNPDKETILTPWRVVNMQLGKTIGGYSFFDDNYQKTTIESKNAAHWIDTEYTDKSFNEDSHILEINSKTGLYPLYAAASLYYKEFNKMNENKADKFTIDDELFLWQKVLRENIFVIAKTPMAKHITERTLAGYQGFDTNIEYIENIVNNVKKNVLTESKEVLGRFDNMKFDVVLGNPPYQEVVGKKDTDNGQKAVTNIFQHFQELADNLAQECTVLIYPGKRWIHQSGKGLKKFGFEQINDPHLKKIIYYADANDIFKDIAISDGISIVLKDNKKITPGFEYEYIENGSSHIIKLDNPGKDLIMINPYDKEISEKIEKFVEKNSLDVIGNSKVLNRALFKIESDFVEKNPDKVRLLTNDNKNNIDYSKSIKLFTNDKAGKSGRATWFIADKDVITVNSDIVNQWKVIVSSANAGGQKRDNQIEILDNHSAFGRSRIALKTFDTKKEAENFFKFATSYIIRYTFLLTDENLSSLGKKVPDMLDYSDKNKLIDYTKDVDNQLQELFEISDDQMEYIKERVSSLRTKK